MARIEPIVIEVDFEVDTKKLKRAWLEANMKIPELYPENLDTLKAVMNLLPALGQIDGIFEVEIRVRIDDVDVWAVIGYGESGDPCVVRFESA